jgi:transposase
VTRIAIDGWPVAKAAEAQGVSPATAHKWIARYRAEGWSGLEDRSSRPHRSPHLTPPEQVAAILRAGRASLGTASSGAAARVAAFDGVRRAGADRLWPAA